MKLKAFAVIDTNVIVSSMISETGFPAQIFVLIEQGNIIPLFDERILDEYYRVLHYPKFKDKITERDAYDALYRLVNNGLLVNDVEQTKVELIDKDDVPFFEVKESSEELDSRLVTGNTKHFPDDKNIVSPQTMISVMTQFDKLLERMEKQWKYEMNYNQSVEELIKQQIATSKYTPGKELIDEMFDSEEKKIKRAFFETN